MKGDGELFEEDFFSNRRVVFGVLLGVFLVVLVLLVTWSNVQDVEFGAEITDYHSDGDSAFIELAGGANKENITLVSFTFTDADGAEYIYETTEGIQNISVPYFRFLFWKIYRGGYGYSVKAADVGLDNFDDVVSVKVGFSYEVKGKETPSKIVKTNTLAKAVPDPEESPTNGGVTIPPVTNETGNETENETCVSTVTCGAGDCDQIADGCGGTVYCGECSLPCDIGINCFYVSVDGSGDGSSVGDAMNLTEAKLAARAGNTFLLLGGNYGYVKFNQAYNYYGTDHYGTSWSSPIIYRAASGAKVVFDSLLIRAHGDEPNLHRYLILEDINVEPGTVQISDVSNVHLRNFNVTGVWGDYASEITFYGVNMRMTQDNMEDILIEGFDISYYKKAINYAGEIKNVVLRNNHLHNLTSSAIGCGGGLTGNSLIEGNLIHDQNALQESPTSTGSTHGSGMALRCSNLVIRNNTVYNYGNTRPIRFYQGAVDGMPVLGLDGYENIILENNLVYMTPGAPYNSYVEIIDAGKNFTVRGNTFTGGFVSRLVASHDGSEYYFYNNLLSGMTFDNDYYGGLRSQTCEEAGANWANVNEGNNIWPNSPAANGDGYLCWYDEFNSESNSLIKYNVHNSHSEELEPPRQWFRDLFVDYDNQDFRPKMSSVVCDGSLWTSVGEKAAGVLDCA
jgi:hypothetical protein